MNVKTMLIAGVALAGVLVSSSAFATGFCGGIDKNGCSVSPVTYKGCLKDLKGDIKDLRCDIIAFLFGRGSSNEIVLDLNEIKFDLATLNSLRPPGRRYF